MVLPARLSGVVRVSSFVYRQNAPGERLYMSTTLISAPLAAERITELGPTA